MEGGSVKVKMSTPTRWGGKRLAVGDTIDVAPEVAERWEKARIAEKQAPKPAKKQDKE